MHENSSPAVRVDSAAAYRRPVYGEPAPGDQRYSAMIIVPNRDGKNFAASQIMLDIAQDPFMASVYRTVLIVGLKEFFGLGADFWKRADACQILPERVAKINARRAS